MTRIDPKLITAKFHKDNAVTKYTKRAGIWQWKRANGDIIAVTARFDQLADGKKSILPYSLKDDILDKGINFDGKRPLWRLPDLLATELPILLVEGEKCASYAKKHAQGFFSTCWIGGTGGFSKTDFSPLAGKNVFIFPDNDEAGLKCANNIAKLLSDMKIQHHILPALVGLPKKGADCADLLPDELASYLSENAVMPNNITTPASDVDGFAENFDALSCPFGNPHDEIVRLANVQIELGRGGKPIAPLSAVKTVLSQYEMNGTLKIMKDSFKRNVLNADFVEKNAGNKEFLRLIREDLNNAITHIRTLIYRTHNFEPSASDTRDAVESISVFNQYHPIKNYLEGLEWDGKKRVECLLPSFFKTDRNELSMATSRMLMVAAIKRVYEPGCKFDMMMVLESPRQGLGKSTGIEKLFGKEYVTADQIIQLRSRELVEATNGFWCIEIADLDGMTKADDGTIKNLLSRQSETARRAYSRVEQTELRQWVTIGTTNKSVWIKDPTGGRRFMPFRCHDYIDIAGIEQERDQLWAESMQMYRDGFSIELPRELWEIAGVEQSKRYLPYYLSAKIRKAIKRLGFTVTSEDKRFYISVDAIFSDMGISPIHQNQAMQDAITNELQNFGYIYTGNDDLWEKP